VTLRTPITAGTVRSSSRSRHSQLSAIAFIAIADLT
jgi:hypothetical protein